MMQGGLTRRHIALTFKSDFTALRMSETKHFDVANWLLG
jgi:hypothetical protein